MNVKSAVASFGSIFKKGKSDKKEKIKETEVDRDLQLEAKRVGADKKFKMEYSSINVGQVIEKEIPESLRGKRKLIKNWMKDSFGHEDKIRKIDFEDLNEKNELGDGNGGDYTVADEITDIGCNTASSLGELFSGFGLDLGGVLNEALAEKSGNKPRDDQLLVNLFKAIENQLSGQAEQDLSLGSEGKTALATWMARQVLVASSTCWVAKELEDAIKADPVDAGAVTAGSLVTKRSELIRQWGDDWPLPDLAGAKAIEAGTFANKLMFYIATKKDRHEDRIDQALCRKALTELERYSAKVNKSVDGSTKDDQYSKSTSSSEESSGSKSSGLFEDFDKKRKLNENKEELISRSSEKIDEGDEGLSRDLHEEGGLNKPGITNNSEPIKIVEKNEIGTKQSNETGINTQQKKKESLDPDLNNKEKIEELNLDGSIELNNNIQKKGDGAVSQFPKSIAIETDQLLNASKEAADNKTDEGALNNNQEPETGKLNVSHESS